MLKSKFLTQTLALLALVFISASCSKKASDVASIPTVDSSSVITDWAMAGPTNGGTSNNSTPVLTGSFAIESAIISIFTSLDCSGTAVGSGTVQTGAFLVSNIQLSIDGIYLFFYTIKDLSGNVSSCQSTGLSYTLDTAPLPPTFVSTPTYSTQASLNLTISNCNGSNKYVLAASQPLASDPGWKTCTASATVPVTLPTEGSNSLKFWGLNSATHVVSHSSTTTTIILDTIPPPNVTSWAMSSPASGSLSSDATPLISGTATEDGDVVTVYTTNTCQVSSLVGTGTVTSGAFTIGSFTLTQDGPVTFYYKIADPAGNTLACASTLLSYNLDTTAPTSPSILISGGATSTDFRSVTLTLAATETTSLPMQMCVAEDSDCSTCSWVTFASSKNITLTSGSGLKTVSGMFRDSLGNTTSCLHSTITLVPVTVSPRYSAAPNWNSYVKSSNTTLACDGSESGASACIHGGEALRVTTSRTSCTNLTLADSLGVFDWTCSISGGVAVFDSSFKTGKGLKDLVNATSWKNNSVTLTLGSLTTNSTSGTWWSNTVQALPSNSSGSVASLNSANTIYTLASSDTTAGYNIGASGIGIVTLGSSVLSWNGGAAGVAENCSSIDGSTSSPDLRCIIASGAQNFLWIEGAFDGGSALVSDHGIFLSLATHSKLHNVSVVNQDNSGILLDLASNYNLLSGVTTANNTSDGIKINSSTGNTISETISANNIRGINISSSSLNALSRVIASSNGTGILLNASSSNYLSQITANNNGTIGISLRSSSSNIFSNSVVTNNPTGLSLATSSNFNSFSQTAATNNTTGISLDSSSSNKFTGNLITGNNSTSACSVNLGTKPGLVNTTCTTTGTSGSATYPAGTASDATLMIGIDSTNSFVGKVAAESVNTSSGGTATYASTLDWVNFSNSCRSWGMDGTAAFPSSTHRGRCSAGTCRIWDWSLSLSDTSFLNVSGDGVSSNDPLIGSNCPSQIDGSRTVVDKSGTVTFLENAFENMNATSGNLNGLCEAGESCIYAPNFGAYQGHGSLQTCTFNNGTLTGIIMNYYSTNGR